jgi:hypothetical protein
METVYPHLDSVAQTDTAEVLRVLKSRPAENCETFSPPDKCWFVVVREKDGLSGFIVVEWDERSKRLIAEQIEIEYTDGKPTPRGRAAYELMAAELLRRADAQGVNVVAPVAVGNRASAVNLIGKGFEKVAELYERKPVSRPVAEAVHTREEVSC